MAGPSGVRRLQKGDLLFKEGDSSSAMYLIRSGMIRIFKKKGDQQIEIDTLRSGQIVGEMASPILGGSGNIEYLLGARRDV